ncbi:MAG: hypothetical protein P4L67_01995 [Candidatus Pacebacteria bacterium]|nr:hypothetical protein [Candidatus Paceibacterota bacterium]
MEENTKIKKRGWTAKNFLIGLVLVVLGYSINFLVGTFSLLFIGNGKPSILFYVWPGITFLFMAAGVFGFWCVIPAFQKWGHTQKQWIAWVFFGAVIVIIVAFIYLFSVKI